MSRWLGPDYITRDGLTSLADTCTVDAVKIEVDSPAEYPAWLHVERSCADYHLDLDSTLTPSGATGGHVHVVEGRRCGHHDVLAKRFGCRP